MPSTRTSAAIGLRLIAASMLFLTGWIGTITGVSAQGSSVDVAIWTHENGSAAYDACYVLVGYSDIGCDENADGKVMFADVPYGTYTVHQTADLGPGRHVEDFTIQVTGPGGNSEDWQSFSATIVNTGGASSSSSGATGFSDVAIVTTENGEPVTDACYVLVGYSDVGCDENGDGKITFQEVPVGTYTVRQTADLGSGRSVPDFTIRVTGAASSDGWERFPATVVRSSSASSGSRSSGQAGSVDIALITRAPGTGDLLTGACYVLNGYSNEGCDENGDGQVTFAAIPPGTYTIHQTRTPAGYPTVNDFPITVDDSFPGVPVGYVVKQAREQNERNARNVSFVFVDSRSLTKIVPGQVCIKVGTVSNVACDEDLVDGQVDFLDIRTGTHPLTFSNLPDGWQIMGDDRTGPAVAIEGGAGPQIIYIGVYTGGSGSGTAGTGETGAGSGTGTSGPTGNGSGASAGSGTSGTSSAASSTGDTAAVGESGGFDAMVGEWYGKRREVTLNADGIGIVELLPDRFGNGLTYAIEVDPDSSPVTATITGVTPHGDASGYSEVGDTITLEVQSYPEGDLLVVVISDPSTPLYLCAVGNDTNVQNLCY